MVNRNGPTIVEEGPAAAVTAAALAALVHEVVTQTLTSGLHVIRIGPDGLSGAVDKRREGTVLGR